jgi:hypothetical protein
VSDNPESQQSLDALSKRILGFNLQDLEISSARIESVEERISRLRREEDDHSIQRKLVFWKFIITDVVVYFLAIIIAISLFILSINIILSPSSDQVDKNWAKAIIYAIFSAAVGFIFGRATKTP